MHRPSTFAALCFGLAALAFAAALADAARLRESRQPAQEARRQLAAQLGLTDFALLTEARYTRHPSQADIHAAFQDHPAALDHFPSGSIFLPPSHASLAGKTAQSD